MYLHQRDNWWNFRYDSSAIMTSLAAVRAKQGLLLGRRNSLGFSLQDEAVLTSMALEVIKSSEIEGEILNLNQVRSSLAKRLGFDISTSVPVSRYINGVVEMMLDATQHYAAPMTDDRLFGWHNVLFPSGKSGLKETSPGLPGMLRCGCQFAGFGSSVKGSAQSVMGGFLRLFCHETNADCPLAFAFVIEIIV